MQPRCLLAALSLSVLGANVPPLSSGRIDTYHEINGIWSVVFMEYQGERAAADDCWWNRMVIAGGKIHYYRGQTRLGIEEAYTIHPEGDRGRIDVVRLVRGKPSGAASRGIYWIAGDELWLCWGHLRPTHFLTREHSSEVLVILQRERR
jgi:uncharacterized protein (TIGR03067 family)